MEEKTETKTDVANQANSTEKTAKNESEEKKKADKPKKKKSKKESSGGGGVMRLSGMALLIIAIVYLVVAAFNYRFPSFFSLEQMETESKKPGQATVGVLIHMADDMTSHWLPNDIIYPTILLDNPQNFQLGELEVVRYSTRVLRDNLSRLRTTDQIDKNADQAYTAFSNDPIRWMLPSAEGKYKEGLKNLRLFQARLSKGEANVFPRGDNLIELLSQLNSLLGGVCTRLSMIPSDFNETLSEETAGDTNLSGEKKVQIETGWFEVDDHFYFAQGVAFGIRHVLLAARDDFQEILKIKKATELLDNIIVVLEHTQWEPKYFVMNCSPGSWFPCQNDPMMLNARLQDARQKISSLISMIEK